MDQSSYTLFVHNSEPVEPVTEETPFHQYVLLYNSTNLERAIAKAKELSENDIKTCTQYDPYYGSFDTLRQEDYCASILVEQHIDSTTTIFDSLVIFDEGLENKPIYSCKTLKVYKSYETQPTDIVRFNNIKHHHIKHINYEQLINDCSSIDIVTLTTSGLINIKEEIYNTLNVSPDTLFYSNKRPPTIEQKVQYLKLLVLILQYTKICVEGNGNNLMDYLCNYYVIAVGRIYGITELPSC